MLEAQETRGLTRSDDISRLLPAEAALLARGRTVSDSMATAWTSNSCIRGSPSTVRQTAWLHDTNVHVLDIPFKAACWGFVAALPKGLQVVTLAL